MALNRKERAWLLQLHLTPNSRGLQTEVMKRLDYKDHNTLYQKFYQYHKWQNKRNLINND